MSATGATGGRVVRTCVTLFVLVAVVVLVYFPGLGGDFIFDDFANIVFNPAVHAESLTWENIVRAAGAYDGPIGRPLATIGFAFDYAIGGQSPFPFKVHNLVIHAINAGLVLALVSQLVGRSGPSSPGWPGWGVLAIAMAWAVHPVQVSSVLYVVQRMEMLATLFVLAGLIFYTVGRQRQIQGNRAWPYITLACLVPLAGLLSKENAVLYPLYYLALELAIFRFRAASPPTSRKLKRAYAAVLALGAVAVLLVLVPRYAADEAFAIRSFSLEERLLTQLRVLPMYVGQLVLPSPSFLPFYYDDLGPSTGWLSPPATLAGGLFLAAIAYCAWRLWKRMPVVSLGILWFFLAHAITSGPVNLELAFEHRNYFAALGIILAVAGLLARLGPRLGKAFRVLAAFSVVALLAGLCMIRSATWGDPLVLAMDMVARNPASSRASNDLAATYVRYSMGEPGSTFVGLAIKEFERGAALPNASPLAEQGLILTSAMAGRPADPAWWDSLLHKIQTQPIGPEQHMAVTGILRQHNEGFSVDAHRLAEVYQALLTRKDNWPGHMYAALAELVATDIGDQARARELFVQAVAADRNDKAFANHLLATLAAEGRTEHAQAVAGEMLRLGMINPEETVETETQLHRATTH